MATRTGSKFTKLLIMQGVDGGGGIGRLKPLRFTLPNSMLISAFLSKISQLHARAKEFNWHDVTSGCSFAVT